jgi:putative ABC transport system permease protein
MLLQRIHQTVPTWVMDVDTLEQTRSRWIRERLLPLSLAAIVGGFLLLMVGFGLVGVLWQNVARRTSELGLRRALGATAAQVRGQVVGELLAATTAAVALGAVLFVQLPILGAIRFVTWQVYLYGLAAAAVVLYCFVVLCAMYPGWMATRIHPARALQHE